MKTKAQSKEPQFEEALQRLEQIVQEMESGDLKLEDILKKYEEGNKLAQLCAAKLNEAEKRIEVLMKGKDGSIRLEPFEQETDETAGQSKKVSKSKDEDEDDLF